MGEVWKAWDFWDKKLVALKILKVTKLLEKFKQEFKLLKRLKHPGLVEPFDFNYTSKKIPYFTMELVEGVDLSQKNYKNNLDRFYQILVKIAETLEYLHSQGIVHGDLKPENFKLTKGIFGVKLLDLGLAEKVKSLRWEKPKGTLSYMAPEIFKKKDVDYRADLYSLGIILYEILTDTLPFEAEDPVHLITLHLEREAIPPKKLNDSIPQDLDDLVLNLLEKDPEKRISSARKLKERILDLWGGKKSYAEHLRMDQEVDDKDQLLPLAYLSTNQMIGREKELKTIKSALEGSVKREGSVFLIEGELGIGKSTFLKELKLYSQLEGILFVEVRCFENETSPYQPIKEALGKLLPHFVGDQEKSFCPSLLKEYKDELGLVIPEKVFPKGSNINQKLISFYFKRIAEPLIKGSKIIPFALCFDDLHWAEEGSLKILEYLIDRIDEGRLFLCGSFHKEALRKNVYLKKLINKFSGDGKFRCLKLRPLSIKETKLLIKSSLYQKEPPKELVDYLYRSASGNPFFSLEVLKLLLKNKVIFFHKNQLRIDQKGLESVQIPENVEKVWLSNLARLDEKMLKFLNSASLTRKRFDLETIQFLTGFPEVEVAEILSILLKEDFIRQTQKKVGENLWYEFPSQTLKEILYLKIPVFERKKLHQKLGDYLEKKKEKKEDLAYHFTRSQNYQKAYLYSLLCAQDFSDQFAYKQTLYHLKNALDTSSKFTPEKKRSEKKIEALMVRADFWKKIGELNSALEDYQSILNLAQNYGDKKIEAKTYREMGEIYRLKHDYENGLNCLKNALSIYKKLGDLYGVARTLNNMGNIYSINSKYDEALDSYEKALEVHQTKGVGDKDTIAMVLNNIGNIHFLQHRYQKAIDFYEKSLTIHRELGNQMEIARGLNNIGAVLVLLGKYDEAIDTFNEALKLNEKMENKKEVCFNLENLADAFLRKGDYRKSLKYCQKGLKLSKEIDFAQRSGHILKFMGIDYCELGEYSKAIRNLKAANDIASQIDDKGLKAEILLNQAKLFFLLNKIEKAEKSLALAKEIIDVIKDERSSIKIFQLDGLIKIKNQKRDFGLESFEKALKIAQKLNAFEEILSLNLDIWGIYLDLGQVEKAQEFQQKSEKFLKEIESDAYQPIYFFNLARKNWLEDLQEKAFDLIFKGIQSLDAYAKAEKTGKLELLWRFHHLLGKWYIELYEYEKAYKELEKAGEILKKLSENIKDPELKESYLKDDKKIELLSDVKSISEMLVGKEK